MGQLIGILIVIGLYLGFLYLFFLYIALPVSVIGTIVAMVTVVVNYLGALVIGLRGELASGTHEHPIGPEPAYKNYFFSRAYRDVPDIWRETNQRNNAIIIGRVQWGINASLGDAALFTWPLAIAIGIVGIASTIGAYALFALAGALHMALVAAICAIIYVCTLYLRMIEWLRMVWRRATFVCPHPDCYRRIALPQYRCSNTACGNVHKRLLPGSYGLWRRRCACGSRLPTLSINGRHALAAYCPHCERPLPAIVGTAMDVHIPVIGGPSTGKSTALIRLASGIHTLFSGNGRALSFPNADDQQRFEQERGQLERGGKLLKTTQISPRSFLMHLREPNRANTLLCVYDPAGELYLAQADARRRQHYFAHAAGLLFLIDPFSLPQVATNYQAQLAQHPELEPSTQDPQDVYTHFLNTILNIVRLPRKIRRRRLAVVVTKVDAFDLSQQLRAETDDPNAQSAAVRAWLVANGVHNLVLGLEQQFKQVRYFAAALQGPSVDASQTLEPVRWVLGRTKALTQQPRRGLSWRAELVANVASVVLATALFLSIPSAAVYASRWLLASGTASATAPLAGATNSQLPAVTEAVAPTPSDTSSSTATLQHAVVTTDGSQLGLRDQPDLNALVVTSLTSGTEVEILEELGEWLRVRAGVFEGWTTRDTLMLSGAPSAEPTAESAPRRAEIVTQFVEVNLRAGPGKQYPPLRTLRNGTEVEILDDSQRWVQVRVNGQVGYVSQELLRMK